MKTGSLRWCICSKYLQYTLFMFSLYWLVCTYLCFRFNLQIILCMFGHKVVILDIQLLHILRHVGALLQWANAACFALSQKLLEFIKAALPDNVAVPCVLGLLVPRTSTCLFLIDGVHTKKDITYLALNRVSQTTLRPLKMPNSFACFFWCR